MAGMARIDWFDGSLVDSSPTSASLFADEDLPEPETVQKRPQTENKAIGYKRLLEISLMKPAVLTLEVTHRPGFWNLFDQEELKGDFIVLIVRVLTTVYKDYESFKEKSKITKLLETRFLNSRFLAMLINYVSSLPNVKIVDKRMNTLLWDNPQDFFFQITYLCEYINKTYNNNKEINKKLDKLLKVLCVSAIGVAENHLEIFSTDLFDRIEKLEWDIKGEDLESDNTNSYDKVYPKSFNHLDMLTNNLLHDTLELIEPNLLDGAYESVEHYIEVQFKLLREDYFGPLREGILKYLAEPSKKRHENIRVYNQVRVLHTYVSNNKVGHLIDIACETRHSQSSNKKKQYTKQLMFGSLLVFTNDMFRTVLYATVLDSRFELLNEGYLVVSFLNPVSKNILEERYLMVESETFFEPYHQVLKVLKNCRPDALPMMKYIVDVKPETQPPRYLTPETIYTIKAPDKSEIPFPVLDRDHWPTEHLGLDHSQLKAFEFALTREFAVIQGPPGTGKTFLGVKIASTILENVSLEGTPMLIVCYTNHALDQFLEGILNVTNSVIRLGSQSKSKKLEPYTLNSVRSKMKGQYSYLYTSKRVQLENIYKDMINLQSEILKCDREILCYKYVKQYLTIAGIEYELKPSEEDRVLNWLFESENFSKSNKKNTDAKEDSWESFEESNANVLLEDKLETCFSEKWAEKEIESLNNIIKHLQIHNDSSNKAESILNLEGKIDKINNRLRSFEMYSNKYNNLKAHQHECMEQVDDLHTLKAEQRWFIYFDVVRKVKNELQAKMDILLDKHRTANEELEEVSTLIDSEVVRTARVVGVTTTAAARRHQLMKKIKSPIVIVEEAGEILEAHIIASLTLHCQHLILIGDHKQLRPTAANYKLAKDFNIEVSLFERMIRNGIHARTLTTQRRMRPEFVDLLVPRLYDVLDSHASVLNYPDVKGMKTNLYFFSHDMYEDFEGAEDTWSHYNTFEAEWCVALACYLLVKGYTPPDITILATYNGQVTLIKKLSQKYESLRDVKITAVDNIQGEESRIVILSLVRSNKEGNIGFLSAHNRICVALSRAKEGFYIFGNANILGNASTMWLGICRKLLEMGAIGGKLCLEVPNSQRTVDVKTAAGLHNLYSFN